MAEFPLFLFSSQKKNFVVIQKILSINKSPSFHCKKNLWLRLRISCQPFHYARIFKKIRSHNRNNGKKFPWERCQLKTALRIENSGSRATSVEMVARFYLFDFCLSFFAFYSLVNFVFLWLFTYSIGSHTVFCRVKSITHQVKVFELSPRLYKRKHRSWALLRRCTKQKWRKKAVREETLHERKVEMKISMMVKRRSKVGLGKSLHLYEVFLL